MPSVLDVLRSPGRPLAAGVRSAFSARLGHDFSQVRVHADGEAARSANALSADAYTVGSQLVFASGLYRPETRAGRRLLGHELTHVVQQSGRSLPLLQRQARGGNDGAVTSLESQAMAMGDALANEAEETAGRGGTGAGALTAAAVRLLIAANNNSTLSTELLLCLIWKESGFDPTQTNSSSSATGLMQMTRGAVDDVNRNTPRGVHFEHSEMTNAARNIACGTYYVQMRIDRDSGDVTKGLDHFGTGRGYSTNILACERCLQAPNANQDACLHAIHP